MSRIHPLIGRVEVLVDHLRRRGIEVTTGAVIDAFTALTYLPLEEPESVKAGLRATGTVFSAYICPNGCELPPLTGTEFEVI